MYGHHQSRRAATAVRTRWANVVHRMLRITPDTTAKIKTREQFCRFLCELIEEFRSNPDDWENRDLASFLDAMATYADSVQGFYDNMHFDVDANQPSWRVFADILAGARIYE